MSATRSSRAGEEQDGGRGGLGGAGAGRAVGTVMANGWVVGENIIGGNESLVDDVTI